MSAHNSGACLNCQTHLAGAFCHHCGQNSHTQKNPTSHDLVHEIIHEFLHLGGKIFRTLKVLALKPGELTKEFLEGQRGWSIGAIRLYLTMSIIYFFLGGATPRTDFQLDKKDSTTKIVADLDIGFPTFEEKVEKQLKKIETSPDQFIKNLTNAFPKFVFLLVPLFALFIQLLFRKHQLNYPAYLYFALHLHAAYFMVLALLLPLEFLFDTNIFFTIWSGWYLYKALKNVFNTSPKQTLLRIFLIAFSYLLLFVVAMTGLVGFAIYKL